MADQFGSLTVGKQADLVLYDLTSLSLLPRTDPIGLLVLGRPAQAVESVWVGGDRIIANGKLTTIDMDELRRNLFERSQWDSGRQSATINQIEFHYRSIMDLPLRANS